MVWVSVAGVGRRYRVEGGGLIFCLTKGFSVMGARGGRYGGGQRVSSYTPSSCRSVALVTKRKRRVG